MWWKKSPFWSCLCWVYENLVSVKECKWELMSISKCVWVLVYVSELKWVLVSGLILVNVKALYCVSVCVQAAIDRARSIPRAKALRKVIKKTDKKGPIFVHTYDPRLPSISQIQGRHWRSMANKNSYLKEVFPRPPITAYKRQPNLRNLLVRAKVPKNGINKRKTKGMSKCGNGCPACPFIKEGKNLKINKKRMEVEQQIWLQLI